MLATVPSATLLGVDGIPVDVEVHVAAGLPCFTVVGRGRPRWTGLVLERRVG